LSKNEKTNDTSEIIAVIGPNSEDVPWSFISEFLLPCPPVIWICIIVFVFF